MNRVSVGGSSLSVGNSNLYMGSSTTACTVYPQIYLYNADQDPGTDDYMVPMGKVFTYGSSPWTSYRYTGSVTVTGSSDVRYSINTSTKPLVHAVRNFAPPYAYVYAWHLADGRCTESGNWVQGSTYYASATFTGHGNVSSMNLEHSGSFMPAFAIWENAVNTSHAAVSSMSGAIEFFGEGPSSAVGVV